MVAEVAGMEVGLTVFGRPQAVANLMAQDLNAQAYVDFGNQFFRELNIRAVDAETKHLGKAHDDGHVKLATSMGQLSPSAAGALLKATQEVSV